MICALPWYVKNQIWKIEEIVYYYVITSMCVCTYCIAITAWLWLSTWNIVLNWICVLLLLLMHEEIHETKLKETLHDSVVFLSLLPVLTVITMQSTTYTGTHTMLLFPPTFDLVYIHQLGWCQNKSTITTTFTRHNKSTNQAQ